MMVVCLLACGCCWAELSFAPIFNDGAVLQCEMPVNIWGTADPGETVTVSFAGQEKSAVADSAGKWLLQLDPLKASAKPRILSLSSSNNPAIQCPNLLVGEVWLATGQSNMEVGLAGSDGGAERLKMTLPEIRFTKVPRTVGLPVETEFSAEELAWKTFAPGANGAIAAVAFYFAEQIQQSTGRQVGILQCSYGGTPAEAWTPAWALDAKPELKYLADAIRGGLASGKTKEQWQAEDAAFWDFWRARREWAKTKEGPAPATVPQPGPDNPWNSQAPTVLYENMLSPIIPYTARGVIWYQGESNAGKPDEYRILFPTMIEAWRTLWKRPQMPFFFVQLAAYEHPVHEWAGLRAAQAFTRDTVPHTGMALAIDVGEEKEIHPRAKQPVGDRLARLARAQVYGENIVSRGPVFQRLEAGSSGGQKSDGKLQVVFQCLENVPQASRLPFHALENVPQASRLPFQTLETSDGSPDVPGFEVAGKDGEFHPAAARIVSKDTVELTCPAVEVPVSVRYAWHNWIEPPVTLQNSEGLPAEPFCSNVPGTEK
jgi:sialate O-acetylesterase